MPSHFAIMLCIADIGAKAGEAAEKRTGEIRGWAAGFVEATSGIGDGFTQEHCCCRIVGSSHAFHWGKAWGNVGSDFGNASYFEQCSFPLAGFRIGSAWRREIRRTSPGAPRLEKVLHFHSFVESKLLIARRNIFPPVS